MAHRGQSCVWKMSAPRTLKRRARRIIQRTRRGMHFAIVADKLDLSSTERRLEKEKYNFYGVINKLMYVTPTVRDNCANSHLIFDLSTFLYFTRVSERHFLCRVRDRLFFMREGGLVGFGKHHLKIA